MCLASDEVSPTERNVGLWCIRLIEYIQDLGQIDCKVRIEVYERELGLSIYQEGNFINPIYPQFVR